MKVTYTIEQHDNGIVLKSESEGNDPASIVILDSDIHRAIGKEVWTDIYETMNKHLANRVRVEINIIAEEGVLE